MTFKIGTAPYDTKCIACGENIEVDHNMMVNDYWDGGLRYIEPHCPACGIELMANKASSLTTLIARLSDVHQPIDDVVDLDGEDD